jgi:hypothetical protein
VVAGPVALDVARVGAPHLPPVLGRAIPVALWTVASAILAGWLTLAVVHVRDDYRVSHVQGVWIATAEAARGGSLYPPLFDGEHYSGTRYMPLPILLNAFGSAITGDPIIGGKVVAATLMAVLLATIILVLKRFSCPLSLAFALAAVVVATDVGLQAATTIGGDLLPIVLQTVALTLAAHGRSPRQFALAGGMAGLAFASKLTGVWGALAIITWLAMKQQWRFSALFAIATVATATVTLGVVELLTNGGLSEHLLTFAFAGVPGGSTIIRGPNQLLYNLLGHASAVVVLFPLAVVSALLRGDWRQLSVFHVALMYALLVLMVIYADLGAGFNQLLDLVVLVVLVVGEWVGRVTTKVDFAAAPVVALVIAVTVIWADGLDLVRTVGFDVRGAVAAVGNGSPGRAALDVSRMVGPNDALLAEDPSIYVPLHRQPVVMDPFMLLRLDRQHPEWVDPLIRRISERQFALVVLVVPLEDRTLDYWWNDFQFGPRVAAALRQSYRPDGSSGRYFLYRPR